MYNDMIDGDQFHNDDVHEGKPVFTTTFSPHYVSIDYESAAARNIQYLRERIAREAEYQRRTAHYAGLADTMTT
jgi:hypothetical protein